MHSLSLHLGYVTLSDFSSLPLSTLRSLSLCGLDSREFAEVLTRSNLENLTSLRLELQEDCDSFASVLLACPNLTDLALDCNDLMSEILPVVKVLPQLSSLTSLAIEQHTRTDVSFRCLLSFLSRSSIQELRLGNLSPKQEQLLADALPSLPSLFSLEFNAADTSFCQLPFSRLTLFSSAHLALFSALTVCPLRRLTLRSGAIFETCLDIIPDTQLTDLFLANTVVFADGFDPTKPSKNYKQVQSRIPRDWTGRFPKIRDRFCLIHDNLNV
jgi:hypothetical protein